MKFFEGKVNKLIFLSSIFLGFISPVNSEDFQSKFVQKITIPEDSKQIYLPKAFLGVHETWSPTERLKTVSIGDTISGSDYGKKKNRSFVVGVIQCDYQKKDYFDRFESQISWAGKWGCLAARSKNDIKEFYNFRKDRSVDVFTTNPINSEDIVDLPIPTANAIDAVKFQLAEYKCLWQEGFVTLDILENMMEKEKENDPEFGNLLISTYKGGTNQKEIEEQNKLIEKMGGCRNMVLTWISMSYPEKKATDFIMLLASDGWFGEEDKPIKDIPLREKSYFNNSDKKIYCKEPLPPFNTLEGSNPNALKVKELCSCMWNKFPKNSWERKVLIKLYKNNYEGGVLRQANVFEKLGRNFGSCGGYQL